MSPPDPAAEARRQRDNVLGSFRHLLDGWDEALAVQRAEGLHGHMLGMYGEYCERLLLLGQCSWRLDGDSGAARAWFGRVHAMDAVRSEALRAWAGESSQRPMWSILIDAVLLQVLHGDAASAAAWCATIDETVFCPPEALNRDQRPHAGLARAMVRLLSGNDAAGLALPPLDAPRLRENDTHGLDDLLLAVANGQPDAVPALLASRAARFRARARSRETAINAWGWGKAAQAATFDAWGTAIARIGGWRGLPPPPDTPEHPRVFLA